MSTERGPTGTLLSARDSERMLHPEQKALAAARLLQTLVRERRYSLDDFLEGGSPYWIIIGLFIDGETHMPSTFGSVMNYADESTETSRFILRRLMECDVVQKYADRDGTVAFRLTARFHVQFSLFLQQQWQHILRTCVDAGY